MRALILSAAMGLICAMIPVDQDGSIAELETANTSLVETPPIEISDMFAYSEEHLIPQDESVRTPETTRQIWNDEDNMESYIEAPTRNTIYDSPVVSFRSSVPSSGITDRDSLGSESPAYSDDSFGGESPACNDGRRKNKRNWVDMNLPIVTPSSAIHPLSRQTTGELSSSSYYPGRITAEEDPQPRPPTPAPKTKQRRYFDPNGTAELRIPFLAIHEMTDEGAEFDHVSTVPGGYLRQSPNNMNPSDLAQASLLTKRSANTVPSSLRSPSGDKRRKPSTEIDGSEEK